MTNLATYNVLIRENHVDSYGHVNNAVYLSLFEEARWDIITPKGYGFHEVQEKMQGPVILEVNLKFLKEIRLREQVQIQSEILEYGSKVGRMRQCMVKADGVIACEAIFVFGLFDMNLRKLFEPTPEWRQALGLN